MDAIRCPWTRVASSLAFPVLLFSLLQGNAANARRRKWAQVGDAICKQEEEERARPETRRLMGWIEALLLSRSGLGPLLDELALPMRLSNGARAGQGGWCRLLDPLNGCASHAVMASTACMAMPILDYACCGRWLTSVLLCSPDWVVARGMRYLLRSKVVTWRVHACVMHPTDRRCFSFFRERGQSSAELANRETRYSQLLWRNTSHLFFSLVSLSLCLPLSTTHLSINQSINDPPCLAPLIGGWWRSRGKEKKKTRLVIQRSAIARACATTHYSRAFPTNGSSA